MDMFTLVPTACFLLSFFCWYLHVKARKDIEKLHDIMHDLRVTSVAQQVLVDSNQQRIQEALGAVVRRREFIGVDEGSGPDQSAVSVLSVPSGAISSGMISSGGTPVPAIQLTALGREQLRAWLANAPPPKRPGRKLDL